MGGDGGADAAGHGAGEGDAELWEEGPDAALAAGEDGRLGGLGSMEAEEDEDEDVVGQHAEAVLAGARGELGALDGAPAIALLHLHGRRRWVGIGAD